MMKEMRPRHIVLFIASCLLLLGALCVVAEYAKPVFGPLRWPSISSMLPKTHKDIALVSDSTIEAIPEDTVAVTLDTIPAQKPKQNPDTLPVVKPAPKALESFIAALQEAETKQVRVIHYGDSQIEEDRITSILRKQLQARYGGGGPGLLPLLQTIPTRTVRQTLTRNEVRLTANNGPKRHLVYGPKNQQRDTSLYGPMGQVAILDSLIYQDAEYIDMFVEPYGKPTSANYFSRVRVLKTDSVQVNGRFNKIISLPDSTTQCLLHFSGEGEVYGVSLETPTGVIVDNIPMRGGSGNVFTNISASQLSRFYAETNTRLIILQFGGNVMPWADTPERVKGYAYSMRRQIRYLKSCAPEASILFIGPSDMTTVVDGEKSSYEMLPLMDEQLARLAVSENIAYWSLYKAMGGWNSMMEWFENGLASSDGVHFNLSGAGKAANLLWKWLEKKIAEGQSQISNQQPVINDTLPTNNNQ